jgi:hypothetical protein
MMFLLLSCRKAANAVAAFGFDGSSPFRPDHISGLLGKDDSAATFANAEIILSAGEYKFWTDASLRGRLPAGLGRHAKRGGGDALDIQPV